MHTTERTERTERTEAKPWAFLSVVSGGLSG